jgi:lysophospholipid acyltransferase (LPLAT)-like uncharacterized protein
MKTVLRSEPVQGMLGWLVWAMMALACRTMRLRVEGEEAARAAWLATQDGIIVAGWHGRILVFSTGWRRVIRGWEAAPKPVSMVVSQSPDGEFMSLALRRLGIEPIRGSAANPKKREKDKGGVAALRAALGHLGANGVVCLTPDGPRGPRQRSGPGAALMAQRSGAPILVYAIACRPSIRLKTWDNLMLPLPFARGVVVFDGVVTVARGEDVEQARRTLEDRLNGAQARAEAALGLVPSEPAPVMGDGLDDPAGDRGEKGSADEGR